MSNFGKALDKIIQRDPTDRAAGNISFGASSESQRGFEYEDRVTSRRLEASESIRRMYQPRLYNERELNSLRFVLADPDATDQRAALEELRNQVSQGSAAKGKTLLVTGATDSPAVSVLCRNLASLLVSDESVTALLVDLVNSKDQLQLSDSMQQPGVRDFINDESLLVKNVIYPTGIQRMRVIPTGSGLSPVSELIRTTRFRVLIKDITRRYRERFTILIAPPVTKVSDVELLQEYSDQVILAVPYSDALKKDVIRAIHKLDKSKFLGSVLLDVVDTVKTPLERLGVG